MLNCKNKFSITDTNLLCVFFVAYVALLMRQPPCLVARSGTMANEIFHVRFSFVQGFCVSYCIVKKINNYFTFGFSGRFCYRFCPCPCRLSVVLRARVLYYINKILMSEVLCKRMFFVVFSSKNVTFYGALCADCGKKQVL